MSSICPFAKAASADGGCPMKHEENHSQQQAKCNDNVDTKSHGSASIDGGCPVKHEGDHNKHQAECDDKADTKTNDSAVVSPKCPFGYDSHTFKLGPLSCMICQALLYQSSKCLPCAHKFCKACISRFKDCPLCGADIEKIEADTDLQVTVDRFINGHARIKRVNADGQEVDGEKNVIYGDVSMERGAFLVQQAMRALRAQNIESAKSRLSLCAADIREQLQTSDNTSELCSQLGAVLGMLGDCCRAMGDTGSAVTCYEESVEFLSKLPAEDLKVSTFANPDTTMLPSFGSQSFISITFPSATACAWLKPRLKFQWDAVHLDLPILFPWDNGTWDRCGMLKPTSASCLAFILVGTPNDKVVLVSFAYFTATHVTSEYQLISFKPRELKVIQAKVKGLRNVIGGHNHRQMEVRKMALKGVVEMGGYVGEEAMMG
ncbi:hypothetical protein COCNU_16G005190 [Cocos nucifera]|uniref:RING-type domain-containing protein n=1 Tax=Cocos nucifera TaxID=13894 RepID=A0A8K0IYC9_COCNU|nr:hypothetical protein COCNU_16G005190 [Cocos nucifera]